MVPDFRQKKLFVDKIDKTFGCIRLRWQRTILQAERLSSAVDYGLILVGSISGFVHLVKKNILLDFLDDSRPRKQSAELLLEKEEG